MSDLAVILPLWQRLQQAGSEYVLATVVAVEGSGYRKAGAMMLIAPDGHRAGTISGGCLEAEVARKAFWHTEGGPIVRKYSTQSEDSEVPYGTGCGGIVHILLERSASAAPFVAHLGAAFQARIPCAVATVLSGPALGQRGFSSSPIPSALDSLADSCLQQHRSFDATLPAPDLAPVRVQYYRARPALHIFGAGDDVLPLARFADELGWFLTISDGRSNLATAARFPAAHSVTVLAPGVLTRPATQPTDAAVVMTHSLEQDTRILATLLETPLTYLGVLGPARRTREILESIAAARNLTGAALGAQVDAWLARIHAPMGLDLGGNSPATIALEIISEIQQILAAGTAKPLHHLRGAAVSSTLLP